MTAHRERLPNRRFSETFDIELNGRKYRCSYSQFPDGRLAEIFISNNRVNSDSDTAAKDSAVVCSIALQFGVPLETISTGTHARRAKPRQRATRNRARSDFQKGF